MGITIELEAELPSRSALSLLRGKRDWTGEILQTFKETMREFGQIDFLPIVSQRPQGRLPVHCCEEWPEIEISRHSVLISARSSTCGPGFHAMFCAAIDAILEKTGLRFVETESSCDDTGYFASRDYAALQNYFADWLQNLAKSAVEHLANETSLRLQMQTDALTPDGKAGEVFTPRGPQTKAYLTMLEQMGDEELRQAAQEWFPWWNERMDAADFKKTALQIMWCDLPWRSPADESERQSYIAALSALAKAKSLGGDITLYTKEIGEMRQYLESAPDEDRPPLKTGLGYRRHDCRWKLAPHWTGLLPGYLHETYDDETYQLYCSDFVVHLSALTVKGNSVGESSILPEANSANIVEAEDTKDDIEWRIERPRKMEDGGWLQTFVTAAAKEDLLIAVFTHRAPLDDVFARRFAESLVCLRQPK